jgi:hypothetical protein
LWKSRPAAPTITSRLRSMNKDYSVCRTALAVKVAP